MLDTDWVSIATSSERSGKDGGRHSDGEPDGDPVGVRFLPIFCKMQDRGWFTVPVLAGGLGIGNVRDHKAVTVPWKLQTCGVRSMRRSIDQDDSEGLMSKSRSIQTSNNATARRRRSSRIKQRWPSSSPRVQCTGLLLLSMAANGGSGRRRKDSSLSVNDRMALGSLTAGCAARYVSIQWRCPSANTAGSALVDTTSPLQTMGFFLLPRGSGGASHKT